MARELRQTRRIRARLARRGQAGLTLMEILLAMGIAAILMAVASPALAGSLLDQTRDALQRAGKDISQAAEDAGVVD